MGSKVIGIRKSEFVAKTQFLFIFVYLQKQGKGLKTLQSLQSVEGFNKFF